jgi:hypothetical protein
MNLIDLHNEFDFLDGEIQVQKKLRAKHLSKYQKKIYNQIFGENANEQQAEKRNKEMMVAKKEQLNEDLGINYLRRERQNVKTIMSGKEANKQYYSKENVSTASM